jgi:hypothetical protein
MYLPTNGKITHFVAFGRNKAETLFRRESADESFFLRIK